MPSRILREGIISSEAVNSLSESAENFYRRLMSIVDDYGRYFAHPALLRAACYPLKLDSVSDADVQQRLSECEAARLVAVYGVESKSFLQIANFRQQTRSKSKFPEPVGNDLLSKCEANDKQLLAGSYKSRRDSITITNTNTNTTPDTRARLHGIPASVEEVIAAGAELVPPKPEASCREFWAYYEGQARTNENGKIFWITKGGTVVTNWRVKLAAFGSLNGPPKKKLGYIPDAK